MNKSAAAVILLLAAQSVIFAGGIAQKGNGEIISSERAVSPFYEISNETHGDVRFHLSEEYRVIVTTDSNMDEFVKTTVKGGKLKIGIRSLGGSFRRSFTQLTVDVYAPVLTGISVSGSGRVQVMDAITTPEIEISVSGSGTINAGRIETGVLRARISGSGAIEGNIASGSASFSVTGSGNIRLAGNSEDLQIKISGSGDVAAYEFQAGSADVTISGSGNVRIWAENSIRAKISGSGGVTYRGNPSVDFKGSGSGRVRSA